MRKFALALFALLALCPLFAQAETIAATSTPGTGSANIGYRWYGDFLSTDYGSWQLAATATKNHAELHGTGYYVLTQSTTQVYIAITGRGAGYGEYNAYLYRRSTCMTGYTLSGGLCYPPPTLSCPAGQNWTLSGSNCTRPDCVAPQVRNAGTGVCEMPACVSTASASPVKWYDMGTNPDALKKFVCVGSCMALYSGDSVSKSAIIDGVRHYYAYGGYDYSGAGAVDSCTPGAEVPSAPSGTTEIPVSHCASNQIEGLIDGKLNCWNVPTEAGAAPTLANPDAAATTTGTSTTTVSTVGDVTTTTTTTNNVGGGTTIVTEACTGSNCTTTTQETGADQTEEQTSAGAGAGTGGLYTADATGKTFSGSLTSFKNTVAAAPVAAAAGNFFTVGTFNGSCVDLAVSFTMLGHAFSLDATEVFCGATAQTWYSYIAAGLLLIATGIAFAIAIL